MVAWHFLLRDGSAACVALLPIGVSPSQLIWAERWTGLDWTGLDWLPVSVRTRMHGVHIYEQSQVDEIETSFRTKALNECSKYPRA